MIQRDRAGCSVARGRGETGGASEGPFVMGDERQPIRLSRCVFSSVASAVAMPVLLALSLASGCNKADAAKGQATGPQVVPVDVAVARTDSVQRTVEVVGTLFGEEDATISNKVNGKIIAIYHDVGDRVAP